MCLLTRWNSDKPYNTSNKRYKVFFVNSAGALCGRYRTDYKFKRQGWNTSQILPLKPDSGYHVFTVKRDTARFAKYTIGPYPDVCKRYIVAEVEVENFNRSGSFCNYHSETWERLRITKTWPAKKFINLYK